MSYGVTDAHFTADAQRFSMKLSGLISDLAFLLDETVFNITLPPVSISHTSEQHH
jgi:hypothetical protein